MDVYQGDFCRKLLEILEDISNATFITFDLEMSGISTHEKNNSSDGSYDSGKPTLQQQYDEIKSAAETFQILQLGITVVKEEREKDFYVASPYNFNLSPLSCGGIDIGLERIFSFSSSACDFLHKNGFDFGKIFRIGIPYLSRAEEAKLRLDNSQRAEKNAKIPDLIIESDDTKAVEFCNYTRKTISDWVKKARRIFPPIPNFVNIGAEGRKLTGFQRRLVHQIVRKEFPDLRTYSRCDGAFMQAEKLDLKVEAQTALLTEIPSIDAELLDLLTSQKFQAVRLQRFKTRIAKQKGLGWVFEALCGGDLTGIDPIWFCSQQDEEPEIQRKNTEVRIQNLNAKLREKNQIIVGHNPLLDLVFLYKTFVGPLPSRIEDFLDEIHKLFPYVIDTKFLATHGPEPMITRSGLKELLKPLQKVDNPLILLHEDHRAYGSSFGKDHEAGYDSWMTAELFLKLSAKLFTDQKVDGGLKTSTPLFPSQNELLRQSLDDLDSHSETEPSEPISKTLDEETLTFPNDSNPCVSINPYSILETMEEEQENIDMREFNVHKWLPGFTDKFWTVYVNKLRVNSIDSGICDLAQQNQINQGNSIEMEI